MADNKVYLPQQRASRGKAGYKVNAQTVVVNEKGEQVKQPKKNHIATVDE